MNGEQEEGEFGVADPTMYYKPKPSKLPETPKLEPEMYAAPRGSPFLVTDFRGAEAYNPNPR